jgi:hypothetical protein
MTDSLGYRNLTVGMVELVGMAEVADMPRSFAIPVGVISMQIGYIKVFNMAFSMVFSMFFSMVFVQIRLDMFLILLVAYRNHAPIDYKAY